MTSLNEHDLKVIRWIQELRSCKVSQATELYRQQAKKLADPDHPQRHDIIWEAVQRGEKIEPAKEAAPRSGRSELTAQMVTTADKIKPKEKAVMPEKEKKAKKAKKPAKKAKAPAAPRPEVELAELSRDVELTPAGDEFKHVYTANLFGKKHAAVLASAAYDVDEPKKFRFNPIHISETRLDRAKKYASDQGLPLAVCAEVWMKDRRHQGYAVPEELLSKFATKMSRGRIAMSLSAEARLAYREGGWDGVKFSVAKVEQAAA